MPPDLALLARIARELRFQHAVENHAWQRIARASCDDMGARRLGPNSEQLFRGDLVGDMPLRDTACGSRRQHFVGNSHVLLKLHATPVFGQLLMTALNGEGRVVVLAVGSEETAKHGFVPLFPGRLVAVHELVDVHSASPESWPHVRRVPGGGCNRGLAEDETVPRAPRSARL